MSSTKVLAIDPGYDRCGVAILERKKGKEVLLYSHCVQTNREEPFGERLFQIGNDVRKIIKRFSPNDIAIEKLYFNTNQKTAMGVAEVRGAIVYIAACSGVVVYEYTPSEIKTAVAGWGRADKKQVMEMIPRLIVIEKDIVLDDEYDAIATGLTHLAHKKAPPDSI